MLIQLRFLRASFWGLIFLIGVQFPKQMVLAEFKSTDSSVAVTEAVCPRNLGEAIEEVIGRPEWVRSRWGILIETLKDGQRLYGLDEKKYFAPASNVKLLTTAAALRQLGADFRIRTSIYGVGKPPRLKSLQVVGRGDPSLTGEQLKMLAQQLKRLGVRRISKLIVDDSYFQELPLNSSWEWSDLLFNFAPSVNSLILNENAAVIKLVPQGLNKPVKVEWLDPVAARQWGINNQAITASEGTSNNLNFYRNFAQPVIEITGQLAVDAEADTTAIAIADPASYFLESFRQILLEEGIQVNKVTILKKSSVTQLGEELGFVESPSLILLINKINQDSNNLFAEAIARILGSESGNKTGVAVIKQSLTALGVEENSFILVDGSGLSRQNLVSPEAIVQTLQLMAQSPEAEIYRNSLAVAAEKGTLQRRFINTAVVGNLQGKTGSLTGVSALSGYLIVPDYQPLVFSIIVNYTDQSPTNLRKAIDELVVLMSRLHPC